MYNVMVAGAGKIGSVIALLLSGSGDYQVYLVDKDFKSPESTRLDKMSHKIERVILDIEDTAQVVQYVQEKSIQAIISSLPYFLSPACARVAFEAHIHYLDLTEDVTVTRAVKKMATHSDVAFVPQCGLAPGFISIVAHSLMQTFEICHTAKLRVGALPQRVSNPLLYALTWSTDGLLNQYANVCYGIAFGEIVTLEPLRDLERIELDGCTYEAFNTSGGLGSLPLLYQKKINTLNYKTLRYPGHCEKMRFLMDSLQLNKDRKILKEILERVIPTTDDDVVIIYVSVEGRANDRIYEKSYMKKIYPVRVSDIPCTAIQISTASSACVILDLVLTQKEKYKGFIMQEDFKLSDFLGNRFGLYYAQ